MNETQINNFLRCLIQIDDLNYLALHAHSAGISDLNSTTVATHSSDRQPKHDDHNDDTSSSHDLLIAKVTAMVVLFCASALCGSIPFLLNRFFRWTERHANTRSATVVKCLLYFGGGVLLATTFLHLLPEVQESIEQLQECDILPTLSFSMAELLMCSGFFLMYLIDELLYSYIHQHVRLMEHDAGAAFERGRSIRNSYLMRGSNKDPTALSEEPNKGCDIASFETKSEPKTEGALAVAGVSETPGRTGSLSLQNLIANDVENQKYRQKQYKEDMSGDHQLKEQTEGKESYEVPQVIPQPHHHHHHHHHHAHQQQHGHSHFPLEVGTDGSDVFASSLRGLFIVLALSLHEMFEGMAIGLESDASDVWFMFGAVSAHKLVLAFCVGVELIVARTRFLLCTVYILTFAVVSPIGIGIGILISHNEGITSPTMSSAILQGLACGTLLYVVFFEILQKNHAGLIAYLSLLVGFLVMFGLQQLGEDGHGHSHGSCGNSSDYDHDHTDEQTDAEILLMNRVQNAYTIQTPIQVFRSQYQYQHHPHSSHGVNESNNFARELQILRQASEKIIQNDSKIN
ncbi:PREDICTED: protein zntC [Rhagoletis zephyria]|uniref:protein zntC n=1 Tax=Rhagoletis zephyria TaxID=28612 RepID=UPI0008114939|nr:PREDICTED: protein zntC [Rhagoletis zephyria]XP_017465882.1 PREDICTED: protein zntC [Rhagoletis zephyria]XP_036334937.1 protein zntC [Rhagoletis pomonella]XP_036334938.1 protein zntC [Rhagoletis pomonella]XP_036334939.1 protein zntC [Rhagoletis pomonella]XP_036334940.1 protein zntC [Rhagoletis pomonella]XP_036334941.1 protein zntC [Rhagoletis pomonella]XP_036334942.1 protein zntC [Rhagoletis pomonella]